MVTDAEIDDVADEGAQRRLISLQMKMRYDSRMKDVTLRHILLQPLRVQTRPQAIQEHPIVAEVWQLLHP
jgi:hypothetical protein